MRIVPEAPRSASFRNKPKKKGENLEASSGRMNLNAIIEIGARRTRRSILKREVTTAGRITKIMLFESGKYGVEV